MDICILSQFVLYRNAKNEDLAKKDLIGTQNVPSTQIVHQIEELDIEKAEESNDHKKNWGSGNGNRKYSVISTKSGASSPGRIDDDSITEENAENEKQHKYKI